MAMPKKPQDTSTPNTSVKSRRGVHDHETDKTFSPVVPKSKTIPPEKLSPLPDRKTHSNTNESTYKDDDSEGNSDDSGDELPLNSSVEPEQKAFVPRSFFEDDPQSKIINMAIFYGSIIIALIVLGGYAIYASEGPIRKVIKLDSIRNEYPAQSSDLWAALESGILEVAKLNKPSVYLILYKNDAEETVDRLLHNISLYTSCILNEDCGNSSRAIILKSEELSQSKAMEDYGHLINEYEPLLRKMNIMIVKNVDKVPSLVAPAFHSFCDEITPLVEKAVFFFTMRVPDFPDKDTQYVESVLRTSWIDLKQDLFDPLFARITNMIVKVEAE